MLVIGGLKKLLVMINNIILKARSNLIHKATVNCHANDLVSNFNFPIYEWKLNFLILKDNKYDLEEDTMNEIIHPLLLPIGLQQVKRDRIKWDLENFKHKMKQDDKSIIIKSADDNNKNKKDKNDKNKKDEETDKESKKKDEKIKEHEKTEDQKKPKPKDLSEDQKRKEIKSKFLRGLFRLDDNNGGGDKKKK